MKETLRIGISSSALFDRQKDNEIYNECGIEKFIKYEIEHEEEVLKPGIGFNFIKRISDLYDEHLDIEAVIISKICTDAALRVLNSIEFYGLHIERAIFTGGNKTSQFIKEMQVDMYIGTEESTVKELIESDVAAVLVSNTNNISNYTFNDKKLKLAFDFDKTVVNSESEDIFQTAGLEAFEKHEIEKKNIPMEGGVFKDFLIKVGKIQEQYEYGTEPIQIFIVTARGNRCAQRIIKTLRSWKVRVNGICLLNGLNKSFVLKGYEANLFIDDSEKWVEQANYAGIFSGKVLN